MSETAEQRAGPLTPPAGIPPSPTGPWAFLRRGGAVFLRQREATVFVVAVALFLYFTFSNPAFLTKTNMVVLTQDAAPIIIIAIGEVFLLICGEIDLSVGFTYAFAPFLMHYLIDFYGVPGLLAILLSLFMGVVVGWVNAFLTVTVGVPSFITTLGTAFVLDGIMLTTSHAEPVSVPGTVQGIGHWIGTFAWSEIVWAVVLVAIFHAVLTRTRWGLHTIATGGNIMGAREAGIHVGRIKYGNFMLTGFLGALVGLQIAFQTSSIDPSNGGFLAMFYAVTAAVIGGTAMLGGVGTILGAFFGAAVLAILTDGFQIQGVSANPLYIIFGSAILVAMIANVSLARIRGEGRAR
jgi:simple sugar transport system permease protein